MIRNVLLSTINYDHPQLGMEHAFRGIFGANNVNTFDYLETQRGGHDPNATLMFVLESPAPDWIFFQLQDTGIIRPSTIKAIKEKLPKTVITHWTGDLRPFVSQYLASICRETHITFASSKGQLALFEEAGAKLARYLQIGVDWAEDVMGEPEWTPPFRVPDVVLCANFYGDSFPGTREREAVVAELMKRGIDVGIVGRGWPTGPSLNWPVIGECKVKQQHHVYRRAKVILNVNHFNRVEGYYSDRQLISMASGKPVVCWGIPGLEQEFEQGKHCYMGNGPGEIADGVEYLLNNPGAASSMGRNGRAEILRHHTWFSRVLQALAVAEDVKNKL